MSWNPRKFKQQARRFHTRQLVCSPNSPLFVWSPVKITRKDVLSRIFFTVLLLPKSFTPSAYIFHYSGHTFLVRRIIIRLSELSRTFCPIRLSIPYSNDWIWLSSRENSSARLRIEQGIKLTVRPLVKYGRPNKLVVAPLCTLWRQSVK